MKVLLFQIYAPLVSWGEIAVGGERQSALSPSRSAVLGLIAAALGIRREEEERFAVLSRSLGIAVKLYSGGSALRDFHTVQVPKAEKKVIYHTRKEELSASQEKMGTILSSREYRCDALSVITVYSKDEGEAVSLETIENALEKPVFQLYFGRKSCVPALPLNPKLVDYENLKKALDSYEIVFPLPIRDSVPDWLNKSFTAYPVKTLYKDKVYYYWEEGEAFGVERELQSVERFDQPISRQRWQFKSRREYMGVEDREV